MKIWIINTRNQLHGTARYEIKRTFMTNLLVIIELIKPWKLTSDVYTYLFMYIYVYVIKFGGNINVINVYKFQRHCKYIVFYLLYIKG